MFQWLQIRQNWNRCSRKSKLVGSRRHCVAFKLQSSTIPSNFFSFPLRLLNVTALFCRINRISRFIDFKILYQIRFNLFRLKDFSSFISMSANYVESFFSCVQLKEKKWNRVHMLELCIARCISCLASIFHIVKIEILHSLHFNSKYHYARVQCGSIAFAISPRIQIETNHFEAQNVLPAIVYYHCYVLYLAKLYAKHFRLFFSFSFGSSNTAFAFLFVGYSTYFTVGSSC